MKQAIIFCLLFAGCGKFSLEYVVNSPAVTPENFLSGDRTGTRIVTDREGYVRGSTNVTMHCELSGASAGRCTEESVNLSGEKTSETYQYTFKYHDLKPTEITRTNGAERTGGVVSGSIIWLNGNGKVPGSQKTAHLETRIHMLPLAEETYYQVDYYRQFGLDAGQVTTLWKRASR
ncbi:MAG: DUF3833 family protein [Spirochaetia bacterium]|nr:DUF3833 family protein [Spirochaetia bacterium]